MIRTLLGRRIYTEKDYSHRGLHPGQELTIVKRRSVMIEKTGVFEENYPPLASEAMTFLTQGSVRI